jgi:hypothetical protein
MKANVLLSFAAGMIGGILSHNAWVRPAQAQTGPAVPSEVRAHSFILVNDKDKAEFVFTSDNSKSGSGPVIELLDSAGREIWAVGGNGSRQLSASPGK